MDNIDICIGNLFANLFFFFFSMAQSSLQPFLSLYLLYVGLNPLETGIIISSKLFVSAVSSVFWLRCCSDNDGRRKCMLIMSILILTVSHLVMVLMPVMDLKTAQTFCYGPAVLCPDKCNSTCADNCSLSCLNNCTLASNMNSTKFAYTVGDLNLSSLILEKSSRAMTSSTRASTFISNSTLRTIPVTTISTSNLLTVLNKKNLTLIEEIINPPTIKTTTKSSLLERKPTSNATASISSKPNDTLEIRHLVGVSTIASLLTIAPREMIEASELNDTDIFDDEDYDDKGKRDLNQVKAINSLSLDTNNNLNKSVKDDSTHLNHQFESQLRNANIITVGPSSTQQNNYAMRPAKKRHDENVPANAANDKKITEGYISSLLTLQLADIRRQIFAAMLVIVLAGEILSSPTRMLADESWIRFTEGREPVGNLKQGWALMGSAFGAFIVVMVIEHLACYPQLYFGFQRIVTHFFQFLLLNLFSFLFSLCFPTPSRDLSEYRDSGQSRMLGRMGRGMKLVFRDAKTCLNTFTVIVVGFVQGFIFLFLPWVVYQSYGNAMPSEIPLGMAVSISILAEFVSLFWMARFCHLIGHVISVSFGLVILTLRCVLYSFELAGHPWLAVLGEASSLLSLCLIRGSIYIQPPFKIDLPLIDISPRACLNFFHNAIGLPLGCISASISFHYLGSLRNTYRIAAGVAAAWCAIFLVTYPFCGMGADREGQVGRYKRLGNGEMQMHSIDDDDDDDDDDKDDSNDDDDAKTERDWLETALKRNT